MVEETSTEELDTQRQRAKQAVVKGSEWGGKESKREEGSHTARGMEISLAISIPPCGWPPHAVPSHDRPGRGKWNANSSHGPPVMPWLSSRLGPSNNGLADSGARRTRYVKGIALRRSLNR